LPFGGVDIDKTVIVNIDNAPGVSEKIK